MINDTADVPLQTVADGAIIARTPASPTAKDFSVIVRKRQDMTSPNVRRVNNFLMILFDLL